MSKPLIPDRIVAGAEKRMPVSSISEVPKVGLPKESVSPVGLPKEVVSPKVPVLPKEHISPKEIVPKIDVKSPILPFFRPPDYIVREEKREESVVEKPKVEKPKERPPANFSVEIRLVKTYTELEDPYPYQHYHPSLSFIVRARVVGSPNSMVKFRFYLNGRKIDESGLSALAEAGTQLSDGQLRLGNNEIMVEVENEFGDAARSSTTVTVLQHPGLKPRIEGSLPNLTLSWTKTIGPYYVVISWTAGGHGGKIYENYRFYGNSITVDVSKDRGLWEAIQSGTEGSIYAVVRDRWVQESSNFYQFNVRERLTHVGLRVSVEPPGAGVVTVSYGGYSSTVSTYSVSYLVRYKDTVKLSAVANSGYRFVKWRINGSETSQNPYSFVADRSLSAVAIFERRFEERPPEERRPEEKVPEKKPEEKPPIEEKRPPEGKPPAEKPPTEKPPVWGLPKEKPPEEKPPVPPVWRPPEKKPEEKVPPVTPTWRPPFEGPTVPQIPPGIIPKERPPTEGPPTVPVTTPTAPVLVEEKKEEDQRGLSVLLALVLGALFLGGRSK